MKRRLVGLIIAVLFAAILQPTIEERITRLENQMAVVNDVLGLASATPTTEPDPTQEFIMTPTVNWGNHPPSGDFRPNFIINTRSGAGRRFSIVSNVRPGDHIVVDVNTLTSQDSEGYRWIRIVGTREEWVAISKFNEPYGILTRW